MTDPETERETKSVPTLRVVRGNPTSEELAALVAVLASTRTGAPQENARVGGQWSARGRNVRPALSHGVGAWRASGLPR